MTRCPGSTCLLFIAVLLQPLAGAASPGSGLTLAPPTVDSSVAVAQGPPCEDGVVLDDGSFESGCGWVPSVIDGAYVQHFQRQMFPDDRIVQVCICWLRTRTDDSVDFAIEVYADVEGVPAFNPVASIPVSAEGVVPHPEGSWFSYKLPYWVSIPSDDFYIGVRWNASLDQFFFVATDQSENTEFTEGFFIDDRADEWTAISEASDPIFANHRAMLIRAVAATPAVPGVSPTVALLIVIAMAAAGLFLLRQRA